MNITYPIVCQKKDGRYFIDFYINSKRYRLLTASKIGLDLKPNNYPENLRRKQAELLAKLTYDYLIRNNYSFKKVKHESKLEQFDNLIKRKLSENLSFSYAKALKAYANGELGYSERSQLSVSHDMNRSAKKRIVLTYYRKQYLCR